MIKINLVALIIDLFICAYAFYLSFLLLRRPYHPSSFNFGMALFSMACWVLNILIIFSPGIPVGLFLENLAYFFGLWIVHYFYIFSLEFPWPSLHKKWKIIIAYVVSSALSIAFFIPGFYTLGIVKDFPLLYTKINPLGNVIFLLYFSMLILLALKNLFFNYSRSGGFVRGQLRVIIVGTFLTFAFNIFFSVGIFFITDFNTTPIGALFVVGTLFYIYLLIFRDYHVKQ
ncbi:hypothetical protein KAZ57_00905 [Patescibacteria group bacterium]|nr:hypothetical protein [Patescibacteria group bacterium]